MTNLTPARSQSARSQPVQARSVTTAAPVIPPPEVIAVDHGRVACDGGGGALGHPLVYLEMGPNDAVECPYCDRRFELATPETADSYHDPAPRALADH